MESRFRALPSVERLIQQLVEVASPAPRHLVANAVRETLASARQRMVDGEVAPEPAALADEARERLDRALRASLRTVINATGVVLHTNLGRAPISDAAAEAMAAVATSYSNLEFDLASGERGSRTVHLRSLLRELTGAEDGLVVNNNAGALLLALTALASGREVIVSRGQAVEIGGGFRIPDVLRQSGARLVEVGTTNRTYVADYERAITTDTALLLRVHPSNFRIEGFVHAVGVGELVELARRLGVGVVDDVGSGALLDPRTFGLREEPLVQDSARSGANIVCFSGDKLLGGPQAGILVGRRDAIEAARRHPLARALRIDKMSLAGLEATLRHYQRGDATSAIPVWRMISAPTAALEQRALALAASLESASIAPIVTQSPIGGGSLPLETLSSWGIRVAPAEPRPDWSAAGFARRLREQPTPIVARVEQDAVILDLRTVGPGEDALVASGLRSLLS